MTFGCAFSGFSGFAGGSVGVLLVVSSMEAASLAMLAELQCTQAQSLYSLDEESSQIRCAANSCGVLNNFDLTGYPDTQMCFDFSYGQ